MTYALIYFPCLNECKCNLVPQVYYNWFCRVRFSSVQFMFIFMFMFIEGDDDDDDGWMVRYGMVW